MINYTKEYACGIFFSIAKNAKNRPSVNSGQAPDAERSALLCAHCVSLCVRSLPLVCRKGIPAFT
jgi:hypothetical protein